MYGTVSLGELNWFYHTYTSFFYMTSHQLTYIHVLDEHIFRTANELVAMGVSTLSSPTQSLMFAFTVANFIQLS